jgi:hypothetical protein
MPKRSPKPPVEHLPVPGHPGWTQVGVPGHPAASWNYGRPGRPGWPYPYVFRPDGPMHGYDAGQYAVLGAPEGGHAYNTVLAVFDELEPALLDAERRLQRYRSIDDDWEA